MSRIAAGRVNLAISKVAPALMAGNTVVLKPPTQGAAAGAHMVQCFAKAGLPSGVLSFVTGKGSEIGDYLTTHPLVNCVSFTGGDTGIAICKKSGMVRRGRWAAPHAAKHAHPEGHPP